MPRLTPAHHLFNHEANRRYRTAVAEQLRVLEQRKAAMKALSEWKGLTSEAAAHNNTPASDHP